MKTFRIYLSDTITIERSLVVEIDACSVEDACNAAIERAIDGRIDFSKMEESQVDCTPWDATAAAPA